MEVSIKFDTVTSGWPIVHMEWSQVTISQKILYEPVHEISKNVVCATSKGSDQPVYMCSLIRAFACRLNIL